MIMLNKTIIPKFYLFLCNWINLYLIVIHQHLSIIFFFDLSTNMEKNELHVPSTTFSVCTFIIRQIVFFYFFLTAYHTVRFFSFKNFAKLIKINFSPKTYGWPFPTCNTHSHIRTYIPSSFQTFHTILWTTNVQQKWRKLLKFQNCCFSRKNRWCHTTTKFWFVFVHGDSRLISQLIVYTRIPMSYFPETENSSPHSDCSVSIFVVIILICVTLFDLLLTVSNVNLKHRLRACFFANLILV